MTSGNTRISLQNIVGKTKKLSLRQKRAGSVEPFQRNHRALRGKNQFSNDGNWLTVENLI